VTAVPEWHGVLVGVDGSAHAVDALMWAADDAMRRGSALTAMYVASPAGSGSDAVGRRILDDAERAFLASPFGHRVAFRTRLRTPYPVPTLSEESGRADLTVVGARGTGGIPRLSVGSVSGGLAEYGLGPTVIIGCDGVPAHVRARGPIVVGVDGSENSAQAVSFAFAEAARRGADLVALHAWSDFTAFPLPGIDWADFQSQGHALIARELARHRVRYPSVHVRTRLVCEQPARWLVDEARHSQLVVLGAQGRGGFDGMTLGSVASAVVQSLAAPVALVRGGVTMTGDRAA
jgi:nucleotide-binding universal stress UspA family protein